MIRLGVGLPAYKGIIASGHAAMWRQFGAAVSMNQPNVRLEAFFDVDVCGIDHARNSILDTCRAGNLDWVVMVDSDTWCHGRDLLAMVLEADQEGAAMCGAPVIMKDERTLNVFAYNDEKRLRPAMVDSADRLVEVDGIGGAIIAVCLRQIAGLAFRFRDGTGEDLDFCDQIRKRDGKILCDPRVKTHHVSKADILTYEGHHADRYRITSLRG